MAASDQAPSRPLNRLLKNGDFQAAQKDLRGEAREKSASEAYIGSTLTRGD
jgi:hypothetical protein